VKENKHALIPVESKKISRLFKNGREESFSDQIAMESPLEIYVKYGPFDNRKVKKIALLMRSPGDDIALALGFLFTAGIIHTHKDLLPNQKAATPFQKIQVIDLAYHVHPVLPKEDRIFIANAACGVCGASNTEVLEGNMPYPKMGKHQMIHREMFFTALEETRTYQPLFRATGGSHAVCWFSKEGSLIHVGEDVGRHNALDKVIGHALLKQPYPRLDGFLFFSGRAGFEMLQKAARAGVDIIVAIGAPTTLAIEIAEEYGITLLGFANKNSLNIYSCGDRIQ
jgi:FdhD protein